jgi:O-acetyl-ADP-ribose deacetylase (regulator of RNase III)
MIEVFNGVKIEILVGDITKQIGYDAVVNAANAELMPGGGVAGAIHRAAGAELAVECKPLAPIKPGEAVITSGCNLSNKFIIHCLGPVYGFDKPEDVLLRNCYLNALNLAEDNIIVSIAFPAISTGAFGYPLEEAAIIALKTLIESTGNLKHVKFIRMVLFDQESYSTHLKIFQFLNS